MKVLIYRGEIGPLERAKAQYDLVTQVPEVITAHVGEETRIFVAGEPDREKIEEILGKYGKFEFVRSEEAEYVKK